MRNIPISIIFMITLCVIGGTAGSVNEETADLASNISQTANYGILPENKYIMNDQAPTLMKLSEPHHFCKKCYFATGLNIPNTTTLNSEQVLDNIRQDTLALNISDNLKQRLLLNLDKAECMIVLNKSGQATASFRTFIRLVEKTRGNNLADEQVDSIIQEIRSIDFSQRSWKL